MINDITHLIISYICICRTFLLEFQTATPDEYLPFMAMPKVGNPCILIKFWCAAKTSKACHLNSLSPECLHRPHKLAVACSENCHMPF